MASAKDGVDKAAKKFIENIKKGASDFHNNNGGFVDPHWNRVDDAVESGSKTVRELISESDSAKNWGILDDGTNQGVKHFSDYWERYLERIPSLEQRLGVQAGTFNNSLDGFNNFTTQAEHAISKATSMGTFKNINGKAIYYIEGAANPKKGVIVIVRDGKIQSMMPSDIKSFNKMQ